MNDRFLKACRREEVDATPVWFMRQAGRFLPEYRKIREKHDIISICKNPELCAEVTTLPVKTLGVDAAIMFADIMLPLEGMNVHFRIEENVGPIIREPIRSREQAQSLVEFDAKAAVPFTLDAIRRAKKKLEGLVPLIGFCGGPFTLASYLIEGRPTRDFVNTKTMMYRDPETWHIVMEKLTTAMSAYLQAQIHSGVDAVQLFDSWIGCLSPHDYREYVLSYSRRIFKDLEDTGVPRIHFGTGTSALLEDMKEAGGDVFGVDWRIPIGEAWRRLSHDVAVQGNLDPVALLAGAGLLKSRAKDILMQTNGSPGHIFNLGHGILADTPVENAVELVNFVHTFTTNFTSQG
jgi:uroporphyrinogen decarboxylase